LIQQLQLQIVHLQHQRKPYQTLRLLELSTAERARSFQLVLS
jgi:hypothetical protein